MQARVAQIAGHVLGGGLVDRDDAEYLARVGGDDVYDLFYWANKIRIAKMGRDVKFCAIVAAKVGGCSEDCKFCAQSEHHDGPAKEQAKLTDEQVLDSAWHAASVGADSFGIVNSGRGPTRRELEEWLKPIMMKIATEGKTRACATLGALTPETAKFLYDCGIRRINHNIETSERHYPNIVSTHPFSERINTLKVAKAAGLSLCSGGIFGMGEQWQDRLDMMFTLRELGVDVMPINFLNAIHGTPLEGQPQLAPMECLKIVSVARFVLPTAELKVAGGREKVLRDLQSWIFFAGADSTMIGNYLTTYGRSPEQDHQMVRDLGLSWRAYDGGGVAPASADPKLNRVSHTGKHSIPILYERELTAPTRAGVTRAAATDLMPADVPIAIEANEPNAHGRPSVGVALDAPDVAPASESPRVAIAGWSARTCFGDLPSTWARLLRGDHATGHGRPTQVGERRASALARSVAGELRVGPDAAVIVGTSKGSVVDWFSPPPLPPTSDNSAGGLSPTNGLSPAGLGDIAAEVAAAAGTRGPVLTLSAACASGLHALIRGAMMIRSGEARQVLVVATEASIHPLFVANFQRLGVLAAPGAGCRPFDRRRTGFYIGEAACAVLLQAAESDRPVVDGAAAPAGGTCKDGPVYVDRVAMGGDATHLTGGDPKAKLLRHLLARVIDGRPVDLIHAHGTGTEHNDATELAAIDHAVGDGWPQRPVVYSHKAALGHTLGASGLLGVVLNCMAHTAGVIPPNPLTTDPLPAGRVCIPNAATRRPVRRSLAVAAGFGGPTAVVSLVTGR